ncbi:MAG: hypothetical protein ABL957_14945 [Parvularculaceae bacterium]
MADGQHHGFEDALEAHKHDARDDARRMKSKHHKPEKPKIAFTGEEFGFGYQALLAFKETVRKDGGLIPDAGLGRVHPQASHEVEIHEAYRQPLRTREQALSSLTTESADLALVPFYSPEVGYDTETLNVMSKMFSPLGVDIVEARDHFCLAVYEPQVLDLVQAAHPGSGLTDLMRRPRRSWDGPPDFGTDWSSGKAKLPDDVSAGYKAGLTIDRAAQMMLRDRVDTVFVGPEAGRRCKAKLDGLKAVGVSVEDTPSWVEPHREMSRRVRETLDKSRQTNTVFDPRTGQTSFVSTMNGEAQTRRLYAVALPFEIACRSPEFTIIDDNIEDAEPPKTRFLVCQKNYDHTLFEDVYRITLFRVRHWLKRLDGVKDTAIRRYSVKNPATSWWHRLGLSSAFAFVSGHGRPQGGVRILLQVPRGRGVTSTGELEEYLRQFGVSYATVRLNEDSEGKKPAPLVMDVEFDFAHFDPHPWHGSIVSGFLWRAFDRSKFGMSRLLAAFPYEESQLPAHDQRRWWLEGVHAFYNSISDGFEGIGGPLLGKPVSLILWPFKQVTPYALFAMYYLVAPAFVFGLIFSVGGLIGAPETTVGILKAIFSPLWKFLAGL